MKIALVLLFFASQLVGQVPGDVNYTFTSVKAAQQQPDVVYHLDLSKSKLKTFPTDLSQFVNLKTLDLTKNKISLLPAEVGALISLERLTLSKNKIVILPPQLGKLVNLKVLELSKNDVKVIPEEFGLLRSLEKVDLWFNDIQKVHQGISNLTNLKEISFQGMYLSDELKQKINELLPHATVQFSGGCGCGF